jgi:GT2 family glycosyltransferase
LAYNYNDIDLCLKARNKGYLVVYTPYASLYHLESYTRGYADNPKLNRITLEEIAYFRKRWQTIINAGDQYYKSGFEFE